MLGSRIDFPPQLNAGARIRLISALNPKPCTVNPLNLRPDIERALAEGLVPGPL